MNRLVSQRPSSTAGHIHSLASSSSMSNASIKSRSGHTD